MHKTKANMGHIISQNKACFLQMKRHSVQSSMKVTLLQYMFAFIIFNMGFFCILTDESSAKEVSRVSEASLLCVFMCVSLKPKK